MKTKWVTTTTYDRIQALMRNQEYLHDLEKLEKKIIDEKVLCDKYGLRLVIYPEWILEHLDGNLKEQIKELESAQLFTDWIIQTKINNDARSESISASKMKSHLNYYLRDGKYLTIEIDLTRKKEDIIALIGIEIDIYQEYAGRLKNRDSKTEIDPWKVYDMHKQGIKLLPIARQLSGIEGNPAYNEELKKWDSKVRRAYKKAKNMIAEVIYN